jgi:O-antigen/teichoic acid export membrane protein
MQATTRVAKNTILTSVSQAFYLGLGAIFTILLARNLGAGEFGVLSFAINFTGIFAVGADVGLNLLIIREIARDRSLAGKFLGSVVLLKALMLVVISGLMVGVMIFLGYPQQTTEVVYIFVIYTVFQTFITLFYSMFQAFESMEYQAVAVIANGTLMFVGIVAGLSQHFDVVGFAFIYLAANVIVFVISLAFCASKCAVPRLNIDLALSRSLLKEALPFGLSAAFILLYMYIDSVMLFILKGNIATGLYSAVYRVAFAVGFLPNAYFSAVYPFMARLHLSSRNALAFAYGYSFKLMLSIIFPIAVFTTLLSERIVLFLYGTGYAASVEVLQIVIWALVFSYLNYGNTTSLNAMNKQRVCTIAIFLSMVLNVCLNLLLIPRFSYIGASIVTVLTEAFCFVFLYAYIKSSGSLAHRFPVSDAVKLVGSGALAAFAIIIFVHVSVFGSIVCASAVYVGAIYLSRFFSAAERSMTKDVLTLVIQSRGDE